MLAILLLLGTLVPQPSADSPADQYVKLQTAAMQADATAADVERVLGLFAPDATYEHPAFKMRIEGVEAMRKGRLAQRGLTRNATAAIISRTAIKDVEAITQELSFEARNADGWRPVTRRQLLLFEYKEGRITRIVEYWQK